MSLEDDKSKIDELNRSLYSRVSPDVRTRRKLRYSDDISPVQKSWERQAEEEVLPVLNNQYEDHSMSFLKKILIGSVIFCVIAVGIGAYLFFNGSNLISANNIDITIDGPVSVPGGEPVTFGIVVKNKNNVDLQSVDLSVGFPDGTTDPVDPTQELRKYTKFIGDMTTGGSASDEVKAIIFGEENLQKEIAVSLTYSIKGSTAVFTKTKSYQVLINSSPISLTTDSFKEITSGQEFDMKVNIKSNSGQTLKNILLNAGYPFGFMFISSNLKPISADNTTWRIGDIPPGGARSITIHGKLQGEDSDARAFRFSVGAQSSSNTGRIGTEYMSIQQNVAIQKPFISLAISIDSDTSTDDYVSEFNRVRQVDVSWFNNLPVTVTNATISVHLSGNAYEKTAVSPNGGYFKSVSDDIIWNPQTTPELASIGAGDSGHVTFSISAKDKSTESNPVINPIVAISANVSGDRSQETNVPETLNGAFTRNIKISSNASLSGRVLHVAGPFLNTGPIPPKAEKATTYTIAWTVNNTSSSVGDAKVVSALPAYVKWLGKVSPDSESVTYNQSTGNITWDIGNLSANTVNSARRREAYFQVSFEPGVDLVSQSPMLINKSVLTAVDGFTGAQLESSQEYLTTSFSTDSSYKGGDDLVGQ